MQQERERDQIQKIEYKELFFVWLLLLFWRSFLFIFELIQ